MNEEKAYTLKSAERELKKLKKARDLKKSRIAALTAEMKADSKRIRELEGIYDRLYHEDLQRQIATVWFKEQRMTGAQIEKFLQLSTRIHDKIDILDVATIVQAITQLSDKQQLVDSTMDMTDETAEAAAPTPPAGVPGTGGVTDEEDT